MSRSSDNPALPDMSRSSVSVCSMARQPDIAIAEIPRTALVTNLCMVTTLPGWVIGGGPEDL